MFSPVIFALSAAFILLPCVWVEVFHGFYWRVWVEVFHGFAPACNLWMSFSYVSYFHEILILDCFRTHLLALRFSSLSCARLVSLLCLCPSWLHPGQGKGESAKSSVTDTLDGCAVGSAFFILPVCAVGLLYPGVSFVQDFGAIA